MLFIIIQCQRSRSSGRLKLSQTVPVITVHGHAYGELNCLEEFIPTYERSSAVNIIDFTALGVCVAIDDCVAIICVDIRDETDRGGSHTADDGVVRVASSNSEVF